MRSNHFYFVTETFFIRCHKRLKLCNIKDRSGRGRGGEEWEVVCVGGVERIRNRFRWRRYWKSNNFMTQIQQILSLLALMACKDYTMIKKSFSSSLFLLCWVIGYSEDNIRKLWVRAIACQIKNNLLENFRRIIVAFFIYDPINMPKRVCHSNDKFRFKLLHIWSSCFVN